MRSFQALSAKNNQRLVSKRQIVLIAFGMMFIIFLKSTWSQRLGLFPALFLAGTLPLTFYLAIYPIKISFKKMVNVLDPKLWLPLSYVIWFVALPCVTIFFDSTYFTYNDEIPQAMLSTMLGIVSLQLGLHIIKPRSESIEKKMRIDRYSATLILVLVLILQLYYWHWRIGNGFFFAHGRDYIPIPNIGTGIRDILGESVTYIPLYILAVAFRNGFLKKSITLCLFVIYVYGTLILFLMAGQVRDLFFFFLMTLASSAYMSQIKKVRWIRTGAGILILLVSCIFIIYAARYSGSQIAQEKNQLKYTILNLPSIVEKGRTITEARDLIETVPLYRIFMTQELFFQTVRSLNENGTYGYGSYTIRNLPIIIPRLLWPQKGMIDDTEALIQSNVLYTNPRDLSLTPLTQFYAEGNIIGVFIGFFLIGLIASYAHKVCFSINNRIAGLICWVVILKSIIQFEANIPINLLIGIRNSLIFLAFTFVISSLHPRFAKSGHFSPKHPVSLP